MLSRIVRKPVGLWYIVAKALGSAITLPVVLLDNFLTYFSAIKALIKYNSTNGFNPFLSLSYLQAVIAATFGTFAWKAAKIYWFISKPEASSIG